MIERRRLSKPAAARKKLKHEREERDLKLKEAIQRKYRAEQAARARVYAGIYSPPIYYPTPARLMYALLVKNSKNSEWGSIKAFEINRETPESRLDDLREELEIWKLKWVSNGYFGSDASFKIGTIKTEKQQNYY